MVGRRGVSLMEVLVSIFIILVGLLGVAALLPVGRLEIVQSAKQDRGAACGRAAGQDAQARGAFDPTAWCAALAAPSAPLAAGDLTFVVNSGSIPCGIGLLTYNSTIYAGVPAYADTYCIDPFYIAQQSTWVPARSTFNMPVGARPFPYLDANLPAATYMYGAPRMLRVTLAAISTAVSTDPVVHQRFFDRIFRWSDDQIFPSNPADPQQRPTRLFDAAGAGQSDGNYSWLLTVTPEKRMPDSFVPDSGDVDNQDKGIAYYNASATQYTASVVVFYRRDYSPPAGALDLTQPAERLVSATPLGGGDFRLRIPTNTVLISTGAPMTFQQAQDYLALRENDWLMLCGNEAFDYGANSLGNPYHLHRSVFNWYRVIALRDVGTYTDTSVSPSQDYYYRDVTLAGPDWTGTLTHAALFTGVIGVYTVPAANR